MTVSYRKRRLFSAIISVIVLLFVIFINSPPIENDSIEGDFESSEVLSYDDSRLAINALGKIEIKGRAPKTGYDRDQFGSGWITKDGCDTRNIILNRDLIDAMVDKDCNVVSGILNDPYTGQTINFMRGAKTSDEVQIDHVVALGDAWQKGAQLLSKNERIALSNDPLELLAVSGDANQNKGDGDAATWLPSNKSFRCQYIARQIAIKRKYRLWVTQAEYNAMSSILSSCPNQLLPNP